MLLVVLTLCLSNVSIPTTGTTYQSKLEQGNIERHFFFQHHSNCTDELLHSIHCIPLHRRHCTTPTRISQGYCCTYFCLLVIMKTFQFACLNANNCLSSPSNYFMILFYFSCVYIVIHQRERDGVGGREKEGDLV